jgi:hypothetical protein
MLLEFLEVEAGQDEPLKEVYAFRKLKCAATWVNSRQFEEVTFSRDRSIATRSHTARYSNGNT